MKAEPFIGFDKKGCTAANQVSRYRAGAHQKSRQPNNKADGEMPNQIRVE